jgi:hypothetical protein
MRPSNSRTPSRRMTASLLGMGLLALPTIGAFAAELTPSVTVGAGMRTSFTNTNPDGPGPDVSDFALNSARIYLNGKVTDQIGFMFNTEYNGSSVDVIDAAAQFSFSDSFNVWAGRFLPPSDRANLYGPYYASNWGVYQDGVQDGYPTITTGRADGVMYWGQFGIAKVSAGAFDVPSTLGSSDVLFAGRLQFDFWDPEGGYYLNGSYYGAKDLLAFGLAAQTADGDNAFTADLLLEKKLGNGGVLTLEAEYANYDGLGGYGLAPKSDGYYGLAAYLFPQVVGIGKFQVLAKYGTSTHEAGGGDIDWDTLELNLNYIIKDQAARLQLFYIDKSFDGAAIPDTKQIGLGLQIQM